MQDIKSMTPEQKEVWDKVNQMMDVSYGCAESFVAAVGEYLWGEVDEPIQMISTGFSGGVGGTHEELCGGVSGAAIIIGLLYGRTTNDEAKMVRCKRLIAEQRDRFVQVFGSTTCQVLRDAEFGADEDNPCSALIAPAAFMLLDILEEEKGREREAADLSENPIVVDVLSFDEYKEKHESDSVEDFLLELERVELPHLYRDWIGDQLNNSGDSRQGVGVIKGSVPDIVFLPIPGGSQEIERAGKFEVSEFVISKYPLTSKQFEVFLNDPEGFVNPVWWEGLAVDPELRSEWGEQRFVGDNYPRENVNWFDAVAYCRWFSEQLYSNPKYQDLSIAKLIKDNKWIVRLPTEWEWQMAATGGEDDKKFPWGQEWNDNFAHTKHNQLNKTMAVGMYPAGTSPTGAMDMSGNVWEWCLNCYQEPGDLDLSRSDRRVLRGGSWYHWGSYAHTDMRSRYFPDHRYNAGGFRLACGKPID